ncbi:hypothetical protein [Methyloceanibacter sp.]|uniref:hypothetical protein n=1 Tax=Methyloceanibacter sp. TaxID=1965321 RepID=UPI002C92A11D|nr:hypothetical protein [Methyloceanibacter sp.]HML93685.1 hypothetical protein [Methyloceanibacter sp.]
MNLNRPRGTGDEGEDMVFKGTAGGSTSSGHAISRPGGQSLVQICGNAADHMARAREALGGESLDPAQALDHLDEAISCLKGLSRHKAESRDEAGPAVLAFPRNRRARSA